MVWRQTFRFVDPSGALILFAVINLALLAWSGVRVGGDTGIYTDGARALLDGQPLAARQPSYLGYIAVVAFFQGIGSGLTGLVIAQVAAATVAAYTVYRIALELGGRWAAALSVLIFAVDIDTNRWHAYVLSDSLYTSILVAAAWLVYRAGQDLRTSRLRQGYGGQARPQDLKPYVAASVLLVAAALVRPEGWFVIPAAAIYWVVRGTATAPRRWAGIAAVMACGALLVLTVAPRLSGNVQAVGPGEMLRSGQTIWDYDGWRVPMPDAPTDDGRYGSAGSAVMYAVQHPVSTAALMAARVGVHFAHVRPFFSTGHNVAIVLWLVPVYAFGLVGYWLLRQHVLARWCLAVIGTQTLVVALTHADWDGRYLPHVMPLWYPFVAVGVVAAAARWRGSIDPPRRWRSSWHRCGCPKSRRPDAACPWRLFLERLAAGDVDVALESEPGVLSAGRLSSELSERLARPDRGREACCSATKS